MAIEAVKIPSNIQVEERIIGPLSLRQIAIVLISSGFSYVIWTILSANVQMNIFLHVFSWTPTAIGFAFSFVEINGVSLFTILLLMIEKINKPTVRTFGPRTGLSINVKTTSAQIAEEDNISKQRQLAPDLEQLSSVLDAGIRKEDEGKTSLLDSVQASNIAAPIVEISSEEPTQIDELDWPGFNDDLPSANNTDDTEPPSGPLLRDIIPH